MSTIRHQPLRGLVAGLGVMGSNHLRVLSSLDSVEVIAVVDPDAERRAAAQRAYRHVEGYASVADAFAAHELDFVCVAVPVSSLVPTARAALEAGLHVLVEKPTAPTEGDAETLIADAARHGLVLAVGHVERFNPAVVALKDKLAEGAIGTVHQMHARRLSPFPNRDSMLGVSLDLATHDIDVMRYISGSEVARVFAETSQHYHEAAEDLLCATLRFDDGATGLLEVNWITPTKVRELTVTGERGMLRVDYLTQDLYLFEHPSQSTEWDALAGMRGGGEGNMTRFALERREPLRVEWEAFVDAVHAGTPAAVTGHDGLAALSTAIAIQQAGTTHEIVVPSYRAAARR